MQTQATPAQGQVAATPVTAAIYCILTENGKSTTELSWLVT